MVKSLPVRSIVDAIDAAATAWRNPALEARQRARSAVSERMEYSLPVVDYAFDRLFRSITADGLRRVIAAELGSLDALDTFVEREPGLFAKALGIGRVCVVSSRTTIGVAILPAIFALSAKCDVLVKDREDHLVAAFFATLAEVLPEFGPAAVALPWRGERDRVDLAEYDCVVAFGADATLNAISNTLRVPTRYIAYPAKSSAGYVAAQALQCESEAGALGRDAARDMLLYDGEGCLSLHLLFVERGGLVSPQAFCTLLRRGIDTVEVRFPAVPRIEGAARRAMARDLAAFRTGAADREDAAASSLVLLDAPVQEAPLLAPRAINVRSVEAPADALEYLRRHQISLESLAVAPGDGGARDFAAASGAARIAPFGSLQAPRLGNPHGGRPRIAEFVRWIVDET
ncbi:MAG TPA: acyl-CoA reductase [Candidatus Cybelea sp.]